ncbi:methylthioribulose 1-phosphate dehydratase [Martiniozyma asiatica (nom. inval.)]|nr:methylthioribulose 1-phosphate dehydratase [Martiniozyma asiatica]
MGCNCQKVNDKPFTSLPSSHDLPPADESDYLVTSQDPSHPANLIPSLCHSFYQNNWVTGTGGGLSIRQDNHIYLAPSGVQKERIHPTQLFVMEYPSLNYIRKPQGLKPSACTPLFVAAYDKGAGACIHTHSQHAVMATLLWDDVFEISHIEQIKAIPGLEYSDTLQIPIIDNTNQEEDLEDSLRAAIEKWPDTVAVLVRRHGIYVWGPTVWKAKVHNEAIDYLLELAVKMKLAGLPTV